MGRKLALRLSQVMITKNEEKNIERALSWGKDFLYEQIVVDTGSTDRTVEIAKKMGATVLHFEWINDFAAAKNFALKHASGEWIAILDADEYFEETQAKRVMEEIKMAEKLKSNCVVGYILNLRGDGGIHDEVQQTRILKNHCGIHFVGAIHEHLSCPGGLKGYYPKERLNIFHTGYVSEVLQEKIESNRNLDIILETLQKDDHNPDMYGYLGDEYVLRNKGDEAIEAYKKAIEMYGEPFPFGDRPIWSIEKLISILIDRREYEEAEKYYDIAVRNCPHDADFDFFFGKDYFRKCEFEKAVPYLERVLKILNEDPNATGRDSTAHLDVAYEMLSFAYIKVPGHLKDAVRYASVLLHANKKKDNVLSTFLLAFTLLDGDPVANAEVALQGVQKIYDLNDVEDCIIVCRAAIRAEYKEFIALLDKIISPENMKKMAEAVNNSSEG
ncbi:glycosyltransferase [[Clostridium] aminophilum]|uniref:glycosyltransferase n=1 Tax=[Clostridium] aminophilum TaxID=1526 RepID=UPI00333061FC